MVGLVVSGNGFRHFGLVFWGLRFRMVGLVVLGSWFGHFRLVFRRLGLVNLRLRIGPIRRLQLGKGERLDGLVMERAQVERLERSRIVDLEPDSGRVVLNNGLVGARSGLPGVRRFFRRGRSVILPLNPLAIVCTCDSCCRNEGDQHDR